MMLAGGTEAGDLRGARRRVRRDARALDAQRRSRRPRRGRSTRAATASSSPRARPCSSSRSSSTREARGATLLAELVGYGATADASHITLPAPGGVGAVRAARRALDKAGLDPTEIDHVNAHATSTPEGDKAELQAHPDAASATTRPKVVDHGEQVMLGHTLGAAGAIEAVATIHDDARAAASRRRSTSSTPTRPPTGST